MPEGEGFSEFATGFNQAVTGVAREVWGAGEKTYGYIFDDDPTMVDGIAEVGAGQAQAERGVNGMVGGINEMLGLVEHGDPNAGAGGGMPSSGDSGAEGATPGDQSDEMGVEDTEIWGSEF